MDTEGYLNELFHISQQQASQQLTGLKSCWIGTIVKALPDGTVMVANPLAGPMPTAQEQVDPNGNPTGSAQIYGPMQLCTSFAGCTSGLNTANSNVVPGIQMMPFGGSSENEPTKGEMVLVLNLNNDIGYCTCALMLFNNMALAPGANSLFLTHAPIQPGEWLFVNPSGTQIYIQQNGNFTLFSMPKPTGGGGDIQIFSSGGLAFETSVTSNAIHPGIPTPLQDPFDIQFTSANNFEVTADQDIGLQANHGVFTAFSDDTAAVTSNGDVDLQSGVGGDEADIHLLSSGDIDIEAANDVNIASINGGSNAQWAEDLTLTGSDDTVINAQGNGGNGDINLDAVRSSFVFGNVDAWITSNTGDTHVVANGGQIFINTNAVGNPGSNISLQSSKSINFTAPNNMTAVPGNNYAVNAGNGIALAAQGALFTIVGAVGISIVATGADCSIGATAGNVNINPGVDANIIPLGDLNLTAQNGNMNVLTPNGDMLFTPHTDFTVNAGTDVSLKANNGDLSLTVVGKLNSMQFKTDPAGQWEVNAGTISISAAKNQNIGIATTGTGTITIDTGTTITLQDGSGNNVLVLLTDMFRAAFNAHTHMAGATGPPDTKLASGYPLTTNATQAN